MTSPSRLRPAAVAAAVALSAAAVASLPAWAQHAAGADHGSHGASATATTAADAMASAEIRRIDRGGGKVTLRHGEIPNLEMPPMTMVFRVRDGALLEGLKEGDRVRFHAEKDGSQYVVTRLMRE